MKTFFLSFLALSGLALFSFKPLSAPYQLPASWTKSLTITVYSGGGMVNASEKAFFSMDSCYYVSSVRGIDKKVTFVMGAKQPGLILKKLKELDICSIEGAPTSGIINDKPTKSIVISEMNTTKLSLEESATFEIKKLGKARFQQAFDYLMEIGRAKAK
jgi:hypothetical protein